MLTCESVRDLLVDLETGEPVDPALHDHLATCPPCRARARRLRAELETLRRELASLEPSPFLEDAVRATARGAQEANRPRRWLAPVLAVGAAMIVVAFVVLARLPDDALPPGDALRGEDPGGASAVRLPPSRTEVAAQRKARFAEAGGTFETQFFGLTSAPPEGLVLLGRALLARMGPASIDDPVERARVAFDRLTARGRAPDVELVLSAPEASGASALVLARVAFDYAGHVLVEEPLARALGLHAYERPGGVTLGGDSSARAEQSRAHLRLRTWQGVSACEVLTQGGPLPAVPLLSGGLPQALRVVIHGERPDAYFHGTSIGVHHAHGTSFVVADATGSWGADAALPLDVRFEHIGPVQVALAFKAGKHPECLVFLPTLDLREELAWQLRLERVRLEERFQPGAQVTVARVWQGRTAIPSRDSVAHTTADANGVVSIVRVRGERGPLVAREVRADGTVRRYETLVEPDVLARRTRAVLLRADGSVDLLGTTYALWTAGEAGTSGDYQARTALRDALAGLADAAGRDEQGFSRATVALAADPETPWTRLQALLFLCADAKVRAPAVEFAVLDGGAGVRYDLPTDAGLAAAQRTACKVRLVSHEDGLLWTWASGSRAGVGPLDDTATGLPALRAALAALRAAASAQAPLQVTLAVAPAQPALPYGAVRRLLAALLEAGIADVAIENAPSRAR